MRISNKEKAKKQAILQAPLFTILAAVISFIASFITFWNGPINYREQVKQLDWPVTDATVSYVYEYYDPFFGGVGRHSGATVYDTHYEYVVDGQIYTEIIEGTTTHKNVGDVFKIKYNPENPEEHTQTLEPSKSYLLTGSLWGALCLTMVILTVILIRKGEEIKRENAKHPWL